MITDDLKGRTVSKLYRTLKVKSTFLHEDGLGELNQYDLILKLDNQEMYMLEEDNIERWTKKQKLLEITSELLNKIKNIPISELIIYKETKDVYIRFSNNYLMCNDSFFSSNFLIEKFEDVFNESGELR